MTVRLAPLYDIITALPYGGVDRGHLKLAMKIGGEAGIDRIGPRHWRKLAALVHIDEAIVLGYVRDVADQVAKMVRGVRRDIEREGVMHPILTQMDGLIVERARRCGALFNRLS